MLKNRMEFFLPVPGPLKTIWQQFTSLFQRQSCWSRLLPIRSFSIVFFSLFSTVIYRRCRCRFIFSFHFLFLFQLYNSISSHCLRRRQQQQPRQNLSALNEETETGSLPTATSAAAFQSHVSPSHSHRACSGKFEHTHTNTGKRIRKRYGNYYLRPAILSHSGSRNCFFTTRAKKKNTTAIKLSIWRCDRSSRLWQCQAKDRGKKK